MWPTTWQLWACGDQLALQSSRVQSRHHLAILAWLVMIASRTGESRTLMPPGYELYFGNVPQYCVLLCYSFLCLSRLVMSDSSVVIVTWFSW